MSKRRKKSADQAPEVRRAERQGRRRQARRSGVTPPAAELEHARRHVERLYDIMKHLAVFESTPQSIPSVLGLVSEGLRVRIATLIEWLDGQPRTIAWHAKDVDQEDVRRAAELARRSFAYLVGTAPTKEWVRGLEPTAADASTSLESLGETGEHRQRTITLPLAVDRTPAFGVLRVTCHDTLDEIDLAFMNAVANQIAVALDRYTARRREIALRRDAEALVQARDESLHREQVALRAAHEAVAARDAFIAAASHELKNPLGTLMLQLDLLGKHFTDASAPERLGAVRRQVARMSTLVHNLLDVARVKAGRLDLQIEDVDLAEVARDVASRSAEELQRAGCAFTLTADLPAPGRWDRMRLDQVVTNLLSNAMKYGAGKPVALRVERGDDGATSLVVADEGIGIAPADQNRIFQRFERAADKRSFAGLGLGLWIVRHIVEAMGGTIAVASTPGAGSTFRVRFPEPRPARKMA